MKMKSYQADTKQEAEVGNLLRFFHIAAKAMKNDKEKCIEAGANDYISKPVDMDKLLSMLRVWLS